MAKQTINLGTAPTGTGGDTPRSAFTKAQANFDELYNAFYAAKGANSDITSLNALTTALSVGQGGTGVTTMAALFAALQNAGALGKSNIVGTVSQSGGTPTGAIVETGSNANGTYTKFADGTMVCRATNTYANATIGNTAGSMFSGGSAPAAAYPASFVSVPATLQKFQSSADAVWEGCLGPDSATSWATVYPLCYRSLAASTLVLNRFAIGRWF